MRGVNRNRDRIRNIIRNACISAIVFSWVPVSMTGCNRAHYRTKADEEVRSLIDEKVCDSAMPAIPDVQVNRASRMFDPFNPDRPPMPEDDSVAAAYMKVVNGKKHYPLWDVNGRTNTAENPVWWQYLPLDERGVLVLDADTAVRVATLHNTNYQAEIETLYLSALDVSTERFLLSNQLFAGYGSIYTADGALRQYPGANSSSTVSNSLFSRGPRGLALRRQFTTGADLIVGFANNLTWQLSGPTTLGTNSLVDFSFVQPLLRGAGRDVILERLTLAERTLLYNVRAFERYRTGFYTTVTVGRQAEAGPTRRGGLFGGAGLQGFTGLGGGFGTVGNVQNNAGGGAGFGGGGAVPQVGGFLGLVQNQLQIRNAEENVARLRDNLARFEDTLREQLTIIPATQDTIPSQQLQVAQARQALISAQASLLQQKFNYEQTLDNFKGTLGLPPYICIEVKDPILDQFNLISTELKDRRNKVADLRDEIGNDNTKLLEQSPIQTDAATGKKERSLGRGPETSQAIERIERGVGTIEDVRKTLLSKDFPQVREDIEKLKQVLPQRIAELKRLRKIYDQERSMICNLLPIETLDAALIDPTELESLTDKLSKDVDDLEKRFQARAKRIEKLQSDSRKAQTSTGNDGKEQFKALRDEVILPSQSLLAEFAEDVLALQVLQARARVESVNLPEVDLQPEEAVQIAQQQRLDWMNARAQLVDSWRSIEVVADNLESSLDIVFNGNIGDSDVNNLRATNGRLRAGFQWDTALTRMNERNQYRQVLIEYQQAKRNYYRFEDGIWQTLRSQLRNIRYNQYNFELQRYAVRIAAQQITINEDLRQIRESLNQASGPTAARDSISALQDLLNAQNTFLGVWVFYEAQRRNLDQDLGTIRVDAENIWIDPGPIRSDIYGFDGQGAYCPPCQPGVPGQPQDGYPEVILPMDESMIQPVLEQPLEVVTPAGYQSRVVPKRELTLQEYVQP
ncbi:MAG: hypothetical protein ACKN85_04735 [Pirellula sp.]